MLDIMTLHSALTFHCRSAGILWALTGPRSWACRHSSSISIFFRGGRTVGACSGNAAPRMLPATAHRPARRTSGCLRRTAAAATRLTFRPRPSVFTRYSAVTCSAKARWASAWMPMSDKHPFSPIGTASRPWTKLFQ